MAKQSIRSEEAEKFSAYLRTTTKKAGMVFLTKSVALAVSFLVGAIYARILGADLYGVFQLAYTTVLTLAIFTVFGTSGGLIRFIPIYKSDERKDFLKATINFAVVFTFTLSVIFALLLIFGNNFIANTIFKEPRLGPILPIFAFILIFFSLQNVLGGVIQAEKEAPIFILYNQIIDRSISVIVFLGLFYAFYKKLPAISWAKFVSSFIALFLIAGWVLRRYPFLLEKPLLPPGNRKKFLSYSSNLLFIRFTYFLMGQINTLLIGAYSISKEAGFYAIGNIIAGLVVFVLTSFNMIFAPIISELYHKKEFKTLNEMYSAITRLIWIFSMPVFLWIIVFSDRILTIFGPEFAAAKLVLIFLAIGQFINAAVGPNGLMLSMSGHQKWEMANGIAVAVINLGLNILLIPKYGAIGSAAGASVALAIVNLVKTAEVWHIMKMIPYNAKYIKPAIAGVIGTGTLLLLKTYLPPSIIFTFIAAAIGAGVILLSVLFLGIEEEDKILLLALKNKLLALKS